MIRNIIIITIHISFVLRSVISDDAWDRVDIERAPKHRYKYNRPVDEVYDIIPVAVVYEDKDERRESVEKSLHDEHKGTNKTNNNVNLKHTERNPVSFIKNIKDEVVNTTSKFKTNIDINETKVIKKDNIEITTMKDTDDIFINISLNAQGHKNTKADEVSIISARDKFLKDYGIMTDTKNKTDTPNTKLADYAHSSPTKDKNIKFMSHYSTKEIHIPVAVVYDDEDLIRNNKEFFFATRTTQVPTTFTPRTKTDKEKQRRQQQKGITLKVLGINDDEFETTSSHKPMPQEKNEEVELQSKDLTSLLLQMEKMSFIPQKEHTSLTPQNEQKIDNSQKEFKSGTIGKLFESANKNSTKTEKKRRERDPVVPIIKSKSEIYSQTGEFRYR